MAAPVRDMRILIANGDWIAVASSTYVAEFIRAESLDRHDAMAMLGPDLLGRHRSRRLWARIAGQGARPDA